MKLKVNKWVRWAVTPVAAAVGFACGFLAFSLIDGMIAGLISLFPYLSFLRWIGGALYVYLTAVWAVRFAIYCAPSHGYKVSCVVLCIILFVQGFHNLANALTEFSRQHWINMVNPTLSLLVVWHLFSKARRCKSALA